MASPFFSGRIPQELFDRIEENVEQTGRTKTEILVAALEMYLGSPISQIKVDGSDVREELQQMQSAIASLKKELQLEIAELREKIAA